MKIRIEHLRPEGHEGPLLSTTAKVYDAETNEPISGIQKVSFELSATDWVPRAKIEVFDFTSHIEEVEAEVHMVNFGKDRRDMDDMSLSEIKNALRWEGQQRYLSQKRILHLENLLKIERPKMSAGDKKTTTKNIVNTMSENLKFEYNANMINNLSRSLVWDQVAMMIEDMLKNIKKVIYNANDNEYYGWVTPELNAWRIKKDSVDIDTLKELIRKALPEGTIYFKL